MTLKDLVAMLFERGSAMQTYWTFYITVSGAVIAFFGTAARHWELGLALMGAFIVYAAANGGGMYKIATQRRALFKVLKSNAVASNPKGPIETVLLKELSDKADPGNPLQVAAFHLVMDCAVLAGIWLLVWQFPPTPRP